MRKSYIPRHTQISIANIIKWEKTFRPWNYTSCTYIHNVLRGSMFLRTKDVEEVRVGSLFSLVASTGLGLFS